jgi:response regulator RpfG family c-di-GMP phosphodiesterase
MTEPSQYRCETCRKIGTDTCPYDVDCYNKDGCDFIQRFKRTEEEKHLIELCGLTCHSDFQSERGVVLTERNIKALERVIGFAFSYRPDLSKESQEDIRIADDLYHELKKELRQVK